jgi:hypothetical protein
MIWAQQRYDLSYLTPEDNAFLTSQQLHDLHSISLVSLPILRLTPLLSLAQKTINSSLSALLIS